MLDAGYSMNFWNSVSSQFIQYPISRIQHHQLIENTVANVEVRKKRK
jgi:hypothetical protein